MNSGCPDCNVCCIVIDLYCNGVVMTTRVIGEYLLQLLTSQSSVATHVADGTIEAAFSLVPPQSPI